MNLNAAVPVLGLMSGTSLDGVDAVLARIGRDGSCEYLGHWSRRFPAGLRTRLADCAAGGGSSWEVGQLHHDLGRFYARVARDGLHGRPVHAVGLHGQTIFHSPGGLSPATFQLGEPAYLAAELGVRVVSNFRAADLAAGGQGAPLATLFHIRAFARRGECVAVQNLGGMANVTWIDASGRGEPHVLSFDTGPGNMLIDGAMRRLTEGRRNMDRGGMLASRGVVHEALVRRWLRAPYFHASPPKSTGREVFGDAFLAEGWKTMDRIGLSPADRMATWTELTAASIAAAYRDHLPRFPSRVILCGGGALNAYLVARLVLALRDQGALVSLDSCEALGWPVEAVEGGAFALLAYERIAGRPGNLPSTTGARRPVLCGQVTE